jgi:hypothetical protein
MHFNIFIIYFIELVVYFQYISNIFECIIDFFKVVDSTKYFQKLHIVLNSSYYFSMPQMFSFLKDHKIATFKFQYYI